MAAAAASAAASSVVAAASVDPDDDVLESVGTLSADDGLQLELSLLEEVESEEDDDDPVARLLKLEKLFSPVSALCGHSVSM